MRRRLRLVGINIAVGVALLGAAEVALRVTEPNSRRTEAEFVEFSRRLLQPCARLEITSDGALLVGDGSEDRSAFRYPRDKRDGVLRVAIVGESSGATFGNHVAQVLAASGTDTPLELLNCAASGAALEHVERQALEVLGYDLDALIVVFGHNVDFEYPVDEARLWRLSLREYSRLAGRAAEAFTDEPSPPKTPLSLRLRRFESWLRQVAERSRSERVALVLTTPADNLWVVPRTTPSAVVEPAFLDAVYEYAVDRERGIESITRLADEKEEALWQFTAGTWLARAGRRREAEVRLRRAIDDESVAHGPDGAAYARDRAPAAVNEIIRRVADEERVRLVDVEKSVATSARDGLTGWDVMLDHCHLQPEIFVREARVLIGAARAAASSEERIALDAPVPLRDRVAQLRAILDLFVMNRRAGMLNSWQIGLAVEGMVRAFPEDGRTAVDGFMPGYADARLRSEILTGVAYGYWNLGEDAEATEANERARREPFADPWVQLGLFSLRSGNRQEAERAFAQALVVETGRQDAKFFLERLRRAASTRSDDGLD